MTRAERLERKREAMRRRRQDPLYRNAERAANTARRRVARQDLNVRAVEQAANTAARHVARQEPDVRAVAQAADTERRRVARQDPNVMAVAQAADTERRRVARQDPNVMAVAQAADTERRHVARQDPNVRAIEQEANTAAHQRARQHTNFMMATRYDATTGEYVFHQACGTWTALCKFGCGYKHLTNITASYRNKCCAGGRLSRAQSSNWNEAADEWFTLQPLPSFMEAILSTLDFSNHSSSYNNLVAFIATKVDNNLSTSGWTYRGPGPASVFLNGRLIKMILPATSTDQTGGLAFFVYDQLSALATSPQATNVNSELLSSIISGLLEVNNYAQELRMLGAEARQHVENVNNTLISTMPRQGEHFTVCSVMNNRQSGSMTMQIQTRDSNQISNVSMDSPLVEPLSYPLLYPRGEPGWTNKDKRKLKLDQYVTARILRPEQNHHGNYMTAIAPNLPKVPIDSRTGHCFSDDADELQIEQFSLPDVLVHSTLIVNRFQRMARLAEYWICDMYSRQIDQRMDIIRNLESRIMMGQPRSQSQVAPISEEEELERDGAGFNDPDDEDNIVSYVPKSVTGSKRHMKSCARNALQLISNFGSPHVFLTLTCNPNWPEIQSQLLQGQTAFNRFDVTVPVFKARLDMLCANIRRGKYFHGSKLTYELHVIEYQYRGLPHAHMVFRLEDGVDTDNPDRNALIDFVNKYFIAEMPRFEGEEHQNVFHTEGTPPFTNAYKEKCRETVRKHNKHKCAVAINGCKKADSDLCRRGYSNTETRPNTYLDETTDRIVYRRRHESDLLIVPYNLPMMMDWDSHLNIEYSGSSHCAMYIFKYAFKGAAKNEPLEVSSERDTDSTDEITLHLRGRVTCSMSTLLVALFS
jgi:hypothetical protein